MNFNFNFNAPLPQHFQNFDPNVDNDKKENYSGQKYLSLFDSISQLDIFEKMPRSFTISTNNQSYKFNSEILRCSSEIISNFLLENPDSLEYHINDTDKDNILGKIEQLYQAKPVTFKVSELLTNNKILEIFDLNFQFSVNKTFLRYSKFDIELDPSLLIDNLLKYQSFVIKTNKSEYKCNYVGIFASKVISEYVQSNPTSRYFIYNYEDENDEFHLICDFFNNEKVPLSTNNALKIKKIAEELGIDIILNQINDFLDDYYNFSMKFDDEQETIDEIKDLFDLLYNIDKKTVQTVRNNIIGTDWIKTEENVQELAAFIIQVVNSNLLLHSYLVELVIQLDSESNDQNELKVLLPFILKKFIDSFGSNVQNCSIVYRFYQKGIISKNVINNLLNEKANISQAQIDNDKYITFSIEFDEKLVLQVNQNILLWFLPEIIELKKIENKEILQGNGPYIYSFVQFYFDNIEMYKEMRDRGEPNDEITLAMRLDDVDQLQSIILNRQYDVKQQFVPINLFEDFIPDGRCKYLNYCAAYGSIKCFKYLLLNHDKVDKDTFKLAVYGGNTEIIKIVEQDPNFQPNDDNIIENKEFDSRLSTNIYRDKKVDIFPTINPINITISKHQYDLFDWILEKKLVKSEFNNDSFYALLNFSAENGNIHSLVELLDRCFEFVKKYFDRSNIKKMSNLEDVIEKLCTNGFYRATRIIMNAFHDVLVRFKQNSLELVFEEDDSYSKNSIDPFSFFDKNFHFEPSTNNIYKKYQVSFGNLSIVKLFIPISNQYELEYMLMYAIAANFVNIVKYFFENLVQKNEFQIRKENINYMILYSLRDKNKYLFDYIMEQIKQSNPDAFKGFQWTLYMIVIACGAQNIKAVKYITDLILKEKPDEDFTALLFKAIEFQSVETCKYFIDKKVNISFSDSAFDSKFSKNHSFAFSNDEIFSIIKKICPSSTFKKICEESFFTAITYGNVSLVENILKEKIDVDAGLIEVLYNKESKIAKIIIKYCGPKVINQRIENYTPLIIATQNNMETIVELLLNHKDFNKEYNSFNYAFYISKGKITDLFLKSKYLDINDKMFTDINILKQNKKDLSKPNNNINNTEMNDYSNSNFDMLNNVNETMLSYSVKCKNNKMVDLIINHPDFDKKKSNLNDSIYSAIKDNCIEIFKKLIKLIDSDFNQNDKGPGILTFISRYYFCPNNCINNYNFNFNNHKNKNNEDAFDFSSYFFEVFNNPIISIDEYDITQCFFLHLTILCCIQISVVQALKF